MPDGLFKYFPTDEDKLERFTNGQIYLTPPKWFNDPWDFLVRSEPYTEEELLAGLPSLSSINPEQFEEIKQDAMSADFLAKESHCWREQICKIVGVVCLNEEPLNHLMWAHYGESHRGFVAEFWCSKEGKSMSGFQICQSPFEAAMKVDYRPTQPLLKRNKSNLEEVILTKHLDWKYEQEWRVIRALKTGDPHPTREGFVLVWFKPVHLLRVILGLRACPKVKFRLRQMLNHKEFEHVHKEEVYIDPSSRALNLRLLPW
jgi:hypothetical protein